MPARTAASISGALGATRDFHDGQLARAPALVAALAIVALAGCGAPPDPEIHAAQGAIDAARAAGANIYATEEYDAAVTALERSRQAVSERDYRQALNHALDAHERAQEAARMAADQRAVVRSEAEHALATVEATIRQLDATLRAAPAARAGSDTLERARLTLHAAQEAVQESRSAVVSENYLTARDATRGLAEQLREAIAQLDAAIAKQQPMRR